MGKMISAGELFSRDAAKRKSEYAAQLAWEQTEEGAAWRKEQDEYHRRMFEADLRYAEENPAIDDAEEEGADNDCA